MLKTKCYRCHRTSVKRGLCEEHLKTPQYVPKPRSNLGQKKPRAWTRKSNKPRKPHALGRDPTWTMISKSFLEEHPWCIACQKRPFHAGGAKRTVAVHVDHILPVEHFPDKKYEWSNLQALCRSCHGIKSNKERAGVYHDYANEVGIVA